jgi:type I restriction enzyme R subunit
VNAIIKDLALLKSLFKSKMEQKMPAYVALITRNFDDKDVDGLIEHFRDKERRKAFFKEYKEIEMLYEIISPDAFLRPYLDNYATLSGIYAVVRKAYAKQGQVDRDFLRKTNDLVQKHIDTAKIEAATQLIEIDAETIDLIQKQYGGDSSKVINLVKSIEKKAEESSDDPYFIGMAERAKQVQENYEDRQQGTAQALEQLFKEIEANERRKKLQAEKNMDGLTYFVYDTLKESGIAEAEDTSRQIKAAFIEHPNWAKSEKEQRELRKEVTFAVYGVENDPRSLGHHSII